jgi:acetyl esterase/lipase
MTALKFTTRAVGKFFYLATAALLLGSICASSLLVAAESPLVVELWPGEVPDESAKLGPERIRMSPKLDRKQVEVTESTRMITDVSKPTITIHRPAENQNSGTAILICPGGGYWNLYWQLEGEEVAAWLKSIGITGIILKYRVPRRADEPEAEPARRPLQDAQRAVSLVRSKSSDWGINPNRIGIIGFSAGGHLAIATATSFDQRSYESIDDLDKISCRPDFAVAAYSGYLKSKDKNELAPGLRIPTGTPPVFLVHGGEDIISPPEHSVLMYLALKRAGVPADLHIYATATHDFGVRTNDHPCATWTGSCVRWLRDQGLLKDEASAPVAHVLGAPASSPALTNLPIQHSTLAEGERPSRTNTHTTLAISGTRFALNSKPTFLYGISYYGALAATEDFIRLDLDDIQRSGFNWIRVWANWNGFDADAAAVDAEGRPIASRLEKLKWLVRECDRRGIVVDVSLSRGNGGTGPVRLQTLEAHRRAVETLVIALKPLRNWYLDLSNERNVQDKRFTSMNDLKQLRELARRLDPALLVTASDGGDIGKEALREYLRPRDAHSAGRTEEKTREYLPRMKELGLVVPVHYQEPFRRGYSKWSPTAADFVIDLAGAIRGGAAGWCFHNGSEREGPASQPRRSFDLREKRLFDQLDVEERKAISELTSIKR